MSFLKGPLMYYRLFGAKGLLLGAKARLLRLSIQVLVTVPGIKHPISLRLRSTDVELCQEILVHAQYASNLPQSPKVIVDAGANIGLTAIFFANRYPATRIIAVEPDSSNYEMLRKNVAPYPNIIAVRAALWNENGEINLADPGAGQTAYQTFERSDGSDRRYQVVPAVTLDRLMNHFDIHFIDLLKVDIEGSEKEVFERSAPWISSVGVIAIELHDWMRTGCGETVRCAAKEFEREWQQGELTFFVKNYPEANAAIEPHQLKNSSRKNIREKWPLKIVQVT